MTPFELAEPATLQEAIGLLDADDTGIRPVAGGTAVMLMMRTGIFRPACLVSLRKLAPRHARIKLAPDGALGLGAMATLARLERAPEVMRAAPVIPRALRRLANVRVRNVATLGGHLAHGDPHMDLPPVLIALDASVVVAGRSGERTTDVADLFGGYLETTLRPDELITEVIVPPQASRRTAYLKHTTRSADDWPALGLAVSLEMTGAEVVAARVAIGAATDKPERLPGVEAVLAGQAVDDATLLRAGEAAAAEAEVRSDARGSAAYKRQLVRVAVARAIRQAAGSVS